MRATEMRARIVAVAAAALFVTQSVRGEQIDIADLNEAQVAHARLTGALEPTVDATALRINGTNPALSGWGEMTLCPINGKLCECNSIVRIVPAGQTAVFFMTDTVQGMALPACSAVSLSCTWDPLRKDTKVDCQEDSRGDHCIPMCCWCLVLTGHA